MIFRRLSSLAWMGVLLCASTLPAQPVWTQHIGPDAGNIDGVFALGGKAFAASIRGGIFVLPDPSLPWQSNRNGVAGLINQPGGFLFFGGRLFARTLIGGLLVSTDSGSTWSRSDTGVISVYSMASQGGRLFTGTNRGVRISDDVGATWRFSNAGLGNGSTPLYLNVGALLVTPGYVFAGTRLGVYASADSGKTWNPWGTDIPYGDVSALAGSAAALLGIVDDKGIFACAGQGSPWSLSTAGDTLRAATVLVSTGTTLWAGSRYGLLRSADMGLHWTYVPTGLRVPWVTGLAEWDAPQGKSLLISSNGDGVYQSKDGGSNWAPLSRGLCNTAPFSITVAEGQVFAGTNGDGIYKYRQPDEWDPVAQGSYGSGPNRVAGLVRAMDTQAGGVLAATSNGLFASYDAGLNWRRADSGLGIDDWWCLAKLGSGLYAGGASGLYRTEDGGRHWAPAMDSMPDAIVDALVAHGNSLFASFQRFGIYRSAGGSGPWMPANAGAGSLNAWSMASTGKTLVASLAGNLWSYEDTARAWTRVAADNVGYMARGLISVGSRLFTGSGHGVFSSVDEGKTWQAFGQGSAVEGVWSLLYYDHRLWAGAVGMWTLDWPEGPTSARPPRWRDMSAGKTPGWILRGRDLVGKRL
jgi:hypothetical protein